MPPTAERDKSPAKDSVLILSYVLPGLVESERQAATAEVDRKKQWQSV